MRCPKNIEEAFDEEFKEYDEVLYNAIPLNNKQSSEFNSWDTVGVCSRKHSVDKAITRNTELYLVTEEMYRDDTEELVGDSEAVRIWQTGS